MFLMCGIVAFVCCLAPVSPCRDDQWQCPGTTDLCIDRTHICNNVTDCPNGADESPLCSQHFLISLSLSLSPAVCLFWRLPTMLYFVSLLEAITCNITQPHPYPHILSQPRLHSFQLSLIHLYDPTSKLLVVVSC